MLIMADCCTWNALALDGLGYDGERLVAGLTQHLAQLLHAVTIHNDGMPSGRTETVHFLIILPLLMISIFFRLCVSNGAIDIMTTSDVCATD